MSRRKPVGWRNHSDEHALASRGIKTTLKKVRDSNKKVLPKDWLANRIDRQPYRGRIKKWASELYDEIGDKIESGDYVIKDGELQEKYTYKGKERFGPIYIDTHGIMKGIDNWTDEVETSDTFNYKDGDIVIYVAYHLRNILRPIEDWLSTHYDMGLDIYSYRGESVHCELYDTQLTDKPYDTSSIGSDDNELLVYITKNISDRIEGTSEFDIEFQHLVSKDYMDSKNKTEFKDKVADSIKVEIDLMSSKFYNNISRALKDNTLDKYVTKRNKIKGVDKK